MKKTSQGGLVYSTEQGRMCPDCRQPIADCQCKAKTVTPTGDGIVRISRETKGRKGKGVTLVSGVLLDAIALAALGKELKNLCGTGGTVKEGVIEIQGDHRELIAKHLSARWTVKLAGG